MHLANSSYDHIVAAKDVIKYAWHTKHRALHYSADSGPSLVTVAADASFADDTVDRISTEAMVVSIDDTPVIWRSIKQTRVTTSSTKAEYYAR
jgi:hypothetical protein